jgi:hypothetical protein
MITEAAVSAVRAIAKLTAAMSDNGDMLHSATTTTDTAVINTAGATTVMDTTGAGGAATGSTTAAPAAEAARVLDTEAIGEALRSKLTIEQQKVSVTS